MRWWLIRDLIGPEKWGWKEEGADKTCWWTCWLQLCTVAGLTDTRLPQVQLSHHCGQAGHGFAVPMAAWLAAGHLVWLPWPHPTVSHSGGRQLLYVDCISPAGEAGSGARWRLQAAPSSAAAPLPPPASTPPACTPGL